MYNLLIRPFVRRLNIDKASAVALRYFKLIGSIPGGNVVSRIVHGNKPQGLEREVFGLNFYNPVGLGSGLDRKGELFQDLENLGFSFVEIGPLSSESTRKAISNIQQHKRNDILCASISSDYLESFSLAYDFCDFFVIEVGEDDFDTVLDPILDCRISYEGYKPVVAKIPEKISSMDTIDRMLDYFRMSGVDGIETRCLDQTRYVSRQTKGRFPIIANSHIKNPLAAENELAAGASLIVVRSGLVTEGPSLVARILKHLSNTPVNAQK